MCEGEANVGDHRSFCCASLFISWPIHVASSIQSHIHFILTSLPSLSFELCIVLPVAE